MDPEDAEQPAVTDASHPEHRATRVERILANRAIGIPALTVQRFFAIKGLRKAMLLAFNLFICVVPLMVMAFAELESLRRHVRIGHKTSLGAVMVEQFNLRGDAARTVAELFPPNRAIIEVTSIIVVATFAISGFDIGAIFAETFAEAWQTHPIKGWRGTLRGLTWFGLVFAAFGASQVLQGIPIRHGVWLYAIAIPLIMAMNYLFWLATPRLLLDKPLNGADLVPGALLGMVASTVLWGLTEWILRDWFDWYGRAFGAMGIALAMLSWTYVVSIVWVVVVVASAAYWERTASIERVLEVVADPHPEASERHTPPEDSVMANLP